MARTDLTKNLLSRYERLEGQRQNWETHWQEVADYMQPRKADVTKKRARGDKRMEQVFDSSPIQAVELLAASLHGMLTNPSTPWFTLRFKDEDIDNEDEAKLWLESSTDAMYTAFNRSNFQQEIFELYHDLITFGTAAMFIEEDDEDFIKFSTRHIDEVYIAENDKGRIDTIYRKFKLSARAIVQKFGASVSQDILVMEKKDPYKEIEIVHAVYPRADFNPNKKDKKNMPFESVYMEYKNGNELSVSGYKEFPFVVPRYLKASHEIYGRSPAMTALPDVKMLNEMAKTTIKAAFYLDEVTKDTGCLRVIPGSHKMGDTFATLLKETIVTKDPNETLPLGIKPNEVPAVNLECKPGDLVCFDRRIKHASFGGGTHRRMFTMIFEPRYPDDELEALRSIIGLNEGFLAKRAYGDIMINTASPERMVHLEQRLANDSHLNNRSEKV